MIGVVGGYGAVGRYAARLLAAQGSEPLRLGGRDPEAARRRLGAALPEAEWTAVDIEDAESLRTFIRGCRVVVNCAGPSHRTASRVARAAQAAGVHYVDAGSDPTLAARAGEAIGTAAVFAAGALPGLSGLLPRWLACGFDAVSELTAYTGVLDRFTAAGAEDYLAGVLGEDNAALAAWRAGAPCPGALSRLSAVTLPFFPRPLTLLPYLDAEAKAVARHLSLVDGRWYIALDGERLPAALTAAAGLDRAAAVEHVCRASALDAAGRRPYASLLLQLSGRIDGTPATRTVRVQAAGIAPLTGAMAAAVTVALLRGEVPAGVRPAAALPNPAPVIDVLSAADGCDVAVFDSSIETLTDTVGGEV
ncbi:hypothetical protein CAI21_12015 [Alkalilimnicola ehrlichii]|uniref:Saccharopine dehydrogenase NADP binding domain-containing protein n=1 Tax=Alkalilimnicola ehrlichii TaxID=351052 RepID=A0A3E0WUU1_9GAMM|nr:saccharopine dehydrogenase NADP-binding domain-containing protein [Alkalilimnicola ehrlichii]RFA28580.1 hypothetical protein CAI21_12015 [Alkalilimnicola ehrlichii]RFA35745.1 hypothetical protein CAL65_12535 [Alkalilimnicola ehrlichii]